MMNIGKCDICGDYDYLHTIRCSKCMEKTAQGKCNHPSDHIVSHWQYQNKELKNASGFCALCNADFRYCREVGELVLKSKVKKPLQLLCKTCKRAI